VSNSGKLQKQISLADKTTLRVGGAATNYLEIHDNSDLVSATNYLATVGGDHFILGGGSNVLVADAGVEGLVLKICLLGREVRVVEDYALVTVAAGEMLDDVVVFTVAQGFGGLENLSAIPGTVGATPVQNVGAYGVEVSNVIESVTVWDLRTGARRTLAGAECDFAYRDSLFKKEAGKDLLVTAVTFRLQTKPSLKTDYADIKKYLSENNISNPSIYDIREAVVKIRAGKFPVWGGELGTAGSFFKNPIVTTAAAKGLRARYEDLPVYPADENYRKISLAFVLDKVLGLKGYRVGNVALFEKQPLILVTYQNATALEVNNFVSDITEKVFRETGIKIEREVREWY